MEFHSAVSYIKTHYHLIALASGLMEYAVRLSFTWRPMAGELPHFLRAVEHYEPPPYAA